MGVGKNWRSYFTLAAGCWMAGEGARMVMMGLFHQGHYYQPNLFDVFFDWVPLAVLGTVFLTMGLRDFYLRYSGRSMEVAEVESADTSKRRKAKPLN